MLIPVSSRQPGLAGCEGLFVSQATGAVFNRSLELFLDGADGHAVPIGEDLVGDIAEEGFVENRLLTLRKVRKRPPDNIYAGPVGCDGGWAGRVVRDREQILDIDERQQARVRLSHVRRRIQSRSIHVGVRVLHLRQGGILALESQPGLVQGVRCDIRADPARQTA